jgi:hypothetical protein
MATVGTINQKIKQIVLIYSTVAREALAQIRGFACA